MIPCLLRLLPAWDVLAACLSLFRIVLLFLDSRLYNYEFCCVFIAIRAQILFIAALAELMKNYVDFCCLGSSCS